MNHNKNTTQYRPLTKKRNRGKIVLNVSGEVYETRVKTLERFPQTLLGNLEKRMTYYSPHSGRYFFNRSRIFFDAILFFYQSNGILQCPPELPLRLFEEECRFFQIPEEAINSLRPTDPWVIFSDNKNDEELFADQPKMTFRMKMWRMLSSPESSKIAKYYALVSLSMISISVASVCLESLPELKVKSTRITENPWSIMDLVLNTWFLLELIASLISVPDLKTHFKSMMTWIDIIAVIPYFIMLMVSGGETDSFAFVRIVRLFRIIRLLRISKHSPMLQKLAIILQASMDDFKTLFLCFMMVVILGGAFIYFLEFESEESMFTDIPTSVYWATVTITTVGYGDYYPISIQGRIWATIFMFFGALTLCIPIISVITKLSALYEKDTGGGGEEKTEVEVWCVEDEEQQPT